MKQRHDAVVIGAGPNGLAAAITLARAGRKTLLVEARSTIGGGSRTVEMTLPGFKHDHCSAIHPLGVASPFFKSLPLAEFGLEWIDPPACVAHPFDDGTAAVLYRSMEETALGLGLDGASWVRLHAPHLKHWDALIEEILAPLHFPRHPIVLARFGMRAGRSARQICDTFFQQKKARGLFAGLAAHSFLPLEQMPSAAIALVLGLAGHAAGWGFPRGGAQSLSNALGVYFKSLGGEIRTDCEVKRAEDIPPADLVFFDVAPKNLARIGSGVLPNSYLRALEKFRGGPAAFKVDWALSGPIPWKAKDCLKAGTVHLGGTFEEIADSERAPWSGFVPAKPYVLVAQNSLFDATRAPEGKHTAWGYCHVPAGSAEDATERIEAQMERFAPGFKSCVLARKVTTPRDFERDNANLIGGDISGGIADLRQAFLRPAARVNPYSTPVKGWYICSASTPPGAGVHGMCGYGAAKSALH